MCGGEVAVVDGAIGQAPACGMLASLRLLGHDDDSVVRTYAHRERWRTEREVELRSSALCRSA
jgi:hypothetical protein